MADSETATHAPHGKIAPMDDFLACVHCGLCLSACPTYLETGSEADSPRGRIHLMRALEEGTLAPSDSVVRHLDLCLGCRGCETACPSGVPYGRLIEGARTYIEGQANRGRFESWKRGLLAAVLPHPKRLRLFRPFLTAAAELGVARLAGWSWLPKSLRRSAALLPDAAGRVELASLYEPAGPSRSTVALLRGCVTGVLFSRLNYATAKLLTLAGYRVIVPSEQVCCGALPAHLGNEAEARRFARKNVNAFLRPRPDWIVTNAAGCGAMMREYGRLLEDDPVYAVGGSGAAAKVRDVSELLADGSLPRPKRELRARIAYHDACHLAHGQGVREAPRELLRAIPGVELVEIRNSDLCCGSAGTYNLTEPEMAWRLGERKAASIVETGADIVAAGNPGCIVQIRAALRFSGRDRPVLHPVEILARAHGIHD